MSATSDLGAGVQGSARGSIARVGDLVDVIVDPDSFVSWDGPIDITGHPAAYRAALVDAASRTGQDEAVITGCGRIRGRRVAIVASEFGFLAGSVGDAAATRIVAAVRRATAEGLAILACPASGGTRMQEGTPAFVRMIDIARALVDHKSAGLPYVVYLRHPTTGGVLASWGSLGHVTVAEPGALVGFLGPKVHQLLTGCSIPAGVQVSDNLAGRGIIDAVLPVEELPDLVDRVLGALIDPPSGGVLARRPDAVSRTGTAWSSMERTRRVGRAGILDVLSHGGRGTVRLSGTEAGEKDPAMVVALTRLDGQPCVVIGHDRLAQTALTPLGPAALREARRGMRLADELGLPLVAFVDTPGADLSPQAEEGALAGEIARCIGTMATMRVPTVSVLLGQGCGGAALALLPATRTLATEHAWLAPLPPEGASAIVHGDIDHAAQLSESQHVRAIDLFQAGAVDHVIPEVDGDTAEELAVAVAAEVGAQLRSLMSV